MFTLACFDLYINVIIVKVFFYDLFFFFIMFARVVYFENWVVLVCVFLKVFTDSGGPWIYCVVVGFALLGYPSSE